MANENQIRLRMTLDGLAAVQSGLKDIGGQLQSFGRIAKVAAVSLAGIAGITSIARTAKAVIDLGDELETMKVVTGASVRQLVKLQSALREASLDAGYAEFVLFRLQNGLVDAAENGGALEKVFLNLGLSAKDLLGKSATEQVLAFGEALRGLNDDARQVDAAMSVFGRSGAQLLKLFKDDNAFALLTSDGGKFADVMERNANLFKAFNDVLKRAAFIGKQVFAGLLDTLPIAQFTTAIDEAIRSVDWTALGQMGGDFVRAFLAAWREGRVDQFIGLTLAAGIEEGMERGRDSFNALLDWLGGSDLWRVALGGAMRFGVALAKLLVQAIGQVSAFMATSFVFALEGIRVAAIKFTHVFMDAIEGVINFFKRGMIGALNLVVKAINLLPLYRGAAPVKEFEFSPYEGNRARPDTGLLSDKFQLTFVDELAADSARASAIAAALGDSLDKSLGTSLLAIQGASGPVFGTARKELAALVDVQRQAREDGEVFAGVLNKIYGEDSLFKAAKASIAPVVNLMDELAKAEREARDNLVALKEGLSVLEGDFSQARQEKYRERAKYLQMQRMELEKIVSLLKQMETAPGIGVQERQQIAGRRDQAQKDLSGVTAEEATQGPNPFSSTEQIKARFAELRSELGTMQEAFSKVFTAPVKAAFESISDSIEGLINGTMTWGKALQNIYTGIMGSVVKAISDMAAQWLVSHVVMRGISLAFSSFLRLLGLKDAAAVVAAEGSKTPVLATNAALASVSSWGGALVAIGLLAALIASFAGGFREGGYTGAGAANAPAGMVHRGEFVMPASTVDRLGVPALSAIMQGDVEVMSPSVNVGAAPVNVVVLDNEDKLARFMESKAGERIVLKHIGRNRPELGLRT